MKKYLCITALCLLAVSVFAEIRIIGKSQTLGRIGMRGEGRLLRLAVMPQSLYDDCYQWFECGYDA